ncbi:alkaline ceramidase ydc1 [Marasmius tenuissimus]|uniref:Alkaline ceramidase ydc1 n=1 Tax=Marasmius tenuissimus TaxID=585030 RepID=A0ABR3A5K2_9AGAR
MSDEIPMIIFASMNVWATYDARPGLKGVQAKPLVLLVLFNALFTWSYYLYRNPIYHQTVFATLMLCPRIPSEKVAVARSWYIKGTIVWVIAFTVWNLDNIFCDRITGWKVAVGWPTAFLLEGHSWWHFLTGLGTYYSFIAIQIL